MQTDLKLPSLDYAEHGARPWVGLLQLVLRCLTSDLRVITFWGIESPRWSCRPASRSRDRAARGQSIPLNARINYNDLIRPFARCSSLLQVWSVSTFYRVCYDLKLWRYVVLTRGLHLMTVITHVENRNTKTLSRRKSWQNQMRITIHWACRTVQHAILKADKHEILWNLRPKDPSYFNLSFVLMRPKTTLFWKGR